MDEPIFEDVNGFRATGSKTAVFELEQVASQLAAWAGPQKPRSLVAELGKAMTTAQTLCFNEPPPSPTRAEFVGNEIWEVCINHQVQHRIKRM